MGSFSIRLSISPLNQIVANALLKKTVSTDQKARIVVAPQQEQQGDHCWEDICCATEAGLQVFLCWHRTCVLLQQ
jgi:hypothetical protein